MLKLQVRQEILYTFEDLYFLKKLFNKLLYCLPAIAISHKLNEKKNHTNTHIHDIIAHNWYYAPFFYFDIHLFKKV